MVTVTENAVKKFKEVIEEAGRPGEGIRIYLAPGG
jgi:Fe-S cluster assembly iron-binding protein IscA